MKTQATNASVEDFIASIQDEQKRQDCLRLLDLFKSMTNEPAVMWGDAIIGFGSYHYKSERSRQEGDWMLTGFSPRKQNLTIYITPGFEAYGELLETLGKYKTSVSCLYIKKLADVDETVLRELIRRAYTDMQRQTA